MHFSVGTNLIYICEYNQTKINVDDNKVILHIIIVLFNKNDNIIKNNKNIL